MTPGGGGKKETVPNAIYTVAIRMTLALRWTAIYERHFSVSFVVRDNRRANIPLYERHLNVCLVVRDSHIVQELCENRGGRPELSVLTSLLVSVDVKNY